MNEPEVTVAEAAQQLGLTEAAIRKRIKYGHLPARRIGRHTLVIPAREVERAEAQGRLRPGPKKEASPT